MKIVLYTCVTGGYDQVRAPARLEPGIDYVCVGDRADAAPSGFRYVPLPRRTGNPVADGRHAKMYPHWLFPDSSLSIYVDGNIAVVGELAQLARAALDEHAIALYRHPFRQCVYEEAAECAALGHDWSLRIARQMARYRREGFPVRAGLFEANVILRRHHDPAVRALMDLWWRQYFGGVKRDQLSLTYAAWRLGVPIGDLGPSDARGPQRHFCMVRQHAPSRLARFRGGLNRRMKGLVWPQVC